MLIMRRKLQNIFLFGGDIRDEARPQKFSFRDLFRLIISGAVVPR
jgi:hypothetical protein